MGLIPPPLEQFNVKKTALLVFGGFPTKGQETPGEQLRTQFQSGSWWQASLPTIKVHWLVPTGSAAVAKGGREGWGRLLVHGQGHTQWCHQYKSWWKQYIEWQWNEQILIKIPVLPRVDHAYDSVHEKRKECFCCCWEIRIRELKSVVVCLLNVQLWDAILS